MKNLGFEEKSITDKQRESCSVLVMQRLLEKYSEKHNISFDEAFSLFAKSQIYNQLFDYETRLRAEGPDYLLKLFEDNINILQLLLKQQLNTKNKLDCHAYGSQ